MIHSLGTLPPYVSTRGLGGTLAALFLANALVGWIAVGSDFSTLDLIGRAAAGEPIARGERLAIEWSGAIVLATQMTLFALTAGVFLCWLYLSRANLRAFGMRRMQYRRGWTVGAFFVPALNLIRPYQVVSEVWKASDPEAADAFGWKNAETPPLLSLWWGAVILCALFEAAALAMQSSAGGSAARFHLAVVTATLADAAGAIGASFAFFVVSWISRAQREKWNLLSSREALLR